LSGRLLSFAGNVEAEGKAFCQPPREFAGVMYQTVANLRTGGDAFHKPLGCRADVVYTPKIHDSAHADLVIYGSNPENKFAVRDWLQEFIQYIKPDRCATIEALRIPG
jgi:hypothetical protein